MKKTILLFFFAFYNFSLSQMTEVKVDKIDIGFADSPISKTKVELEYLNHKQFVFSFKDEKNQYDKKFTSIFLSESVENMERFRDSIHKAFTDDEIKEKTFKSGDYEIFVTYMGNSPDRFVSIIFQNNTTSELNAMPLIDSFNWFTLFMDFHKIKN